MGNVQRIFQGSIDLDISPLGEKQLAALKKRFDNVYLDKVYTSPLIRAKKTALAVIGEKDVPLFEEKGLIEVSGGVLEGLPFKETLAGNLELADAWNYHPENFAPEKGEPMRHAYERIWETVLKLANENKGKTIACATHGGVTRCLNCRIEFNDITRLADTTWSENTAVTLLRFDDDMNSTRVYANDLSHLSEDLINRRSRIFANKEETK